MQGHIKAHDHYFCSNDCIKKYEKQKNLKPILRNRAWFKITFYTVIVILLIILITALQITGYMILFMGIFFILVSILKFLDWKGFAQAFSMYDILAKRSKFYSYFYPIIELSLGLSFLFSWKIMTAAIVTFFIMTIGTVGVTRNLLSKNPVKCACLGTIIKIPLTKFTLFEDLAMAVMALMILFL